MTNIQVNDFLSNFIHSNNHLGIIYRIPKIINVKFDVDLIMKTYIGCEMSETKDYYQVICVHRGALRHA